MLDYKPVEERNYKLRMFFVFALPLYISRPFPSTSVCFSQGQEHLQGPTSSDE